MSAESIPHYKILHLDLDAFFCAVEEKLDGSLRGKPFAVGGAPDSRGVVASCSYAARKFGVRSAMPMSRAVRLCPDLIIVSHRHGNYGEESRRVMEIVRQIADRVEQISIDEAFLDVTDSPEPAEAIARRLQAHILDERGLPCSIGAATNKLVAKIATDFGKSQARGDGPPNAIWVVPPGEEAAFLAPLPTSALWGVGPKTAARLAELGMRTIGDVARWSPAELERQFGKHGEGLARRARGIDDSPVEESHEVKSISREVTFARDVSDRERLERTLRDLGESVGKRLRKANLTGATVRIKIRWPDFTTFTRQATLLQPTDQDEEIISAAIYLFEENWVPPGRPVRLIGVGVSGLGPAPGPSRQLSLWEAPALEIADGGVYEEKEAAEEAKDEAIEGEDPKLVAKKTRLNEAVQELQERFGDRAIRRGKKLD